MVSVVTVVYNAFEVIRRTLDSVQSQTYDDYEYIIIDGGSTDGTLDVISTYQSIITKLVSEKDRGVYDAMNKGARLCNGDWIVYMNAGDTFASENTLSEIFDNNEYNDIDVIYGDVNCCYTSSPLMIKAKPLPNLKYRMAFCHQASYVRTKHLKSIGFDIKYKYAADYAFFRELYLSGKSFYYFPKVIAKYYPDGGLTDSNIIRVLKEENSISGVRDLRWARHFLYTYLVYILHKIIPYDKLNHIRGFIRG